MRNLIQATLYPGIGAIEATNISVGRGTDTPFEQVGAPWIDGAGAGRGAQRAADSRRPVLPGAVHAGVQQVRGTGVPGRVHDRDRPRGAAPGAARRRDRGDAAQVVREFASSSMPRNGCSARAKESRGFAPGRIRRRLPPHGAPPKRGGGCCGRSTCYIAELAPATGLSCHLRQICRVLRLSR